MYHFPKEATPGGGVRSGCGALKNHYFFQLYVRIVAFFIIGTNQQPLAMLPYPCMLFHKSLMEGWVVIRCEYLRCLEEQDFMYDSNKSESLWLHTMCMQAYMHDRKMDKNRSALIDRTMVSLRPGGKTVSHVVKKCIA